MDVSEGMSLGQAVEMGYRPQSRPLGCVFRIAVIGGFQ